MGPEGFAHAHIIEIMYLCLASGLRQKRFSHDPGVSRIDDYKIWYQKGLQWKDIVKCRKMEEKMN